MCNYSPKSVPPDTSLPEDLILLYDEFLEFQAYCAFFCDSLSAMATAEIVLEDATRRGVSAFSQHLKCRTEEFKTLLKQIQKKSVINN